MKPRYRLAPAYHLHVPVHQFRYGVGVTGLQDSAQLNAGQKSFCQCEASLLAFSKLISSVDGKLISWERSSSIKRLGRKIPFFRKLWHSERLWTSDIGLWHAKYTCLTRVFQEQLWTTSKAWSSTKSTWISSFGNTCYTRNRSIGHKEFVAFWFSPGIFPSKGGYVELFYPWWLPSAYFSLEGVNKQ